MTVASTPTAALSADNLYAPFTIDAVNSFPTDDELYSEIPVIDFAAFREGSGSAKRETALAILAGFQRAGFIYLRNHGISKATVSQAFDDSAKFFKRPLAQKEELAWTSPESNRGYVRQGRENLASDAGENGEKQEEVECKDVGFFLFLLSFFLSFLGVDPQASGYVY